jgi:hypothetical protein
MFANLDRDEFMRLLEKLGSEDDAEALGAARDLHARVTIAQISWDELLVPRPGGQPDEGGYDEPDYDEPDEEEEEENAGAEASLSDDSGAGDGDTDVAEGEDKPVSDAEKAEARELIAKIEALEISPDTKADMADYKKDLEAGEFLAMDLRYLRAFHTRLSK